MKSLAPLILLLAAATNTLARDVYQSPSDFISEVFANNPPKASLMWLNRAMKQELTEILGHRPNALRVRYWKKKLKTVWILDEIGKEHPITTGIIVDQGKIQAIKVLIYRESRGYEVRHPFFTEQFNGARLQEDAQLDRSIDGISGATLSVRALKKMARMALYLDKHSNP